MPTVVELRAIAKKRRIPYWYDMRKDELIRALKRKPASRRPASRKRKPAKRKPASRRPRSISFRFDNPASGTWVVYVKPGDGCPYCNDAVNLLKSKDAAYSKRTGSGPDYEKVKADAGDYGYFPLIIHNGKFFGGYTELEKKLK
jgi:glutaredoxin